MSEASKTTAVTWAKALYGSQEVTPEVVKEMQELDSKWSGMVPNMHDTQPVDVFKNMVNPIPDVNVNSQLTEIKAELNTAYSHDRLLTKHIDTAVSVTEDTPLPRTSLYEVVEEQEPDDLTKFLVEPAPITSTLELENGEILKMTSDPNFVYKEAAPGFLDEAAGVMKQRAALRDSEEGERTAAQIAKVFNAITGNSITEADAWLFLIVMKIVRSRNGKYNRDDYVDLSAYAALLGETESKNRK